MDVWYRSAMLRPLAEHCLPHCRSRERPSSIGMAALASTVKTNAPGVAAMRPSSSQRVMGFLHAQRLGRVGIGDSGDQVRHRSTRQTGEGVLEGLRSQIPRSAAGHRQPQANAIPFDARDHRAVSAGTAMRPKSYGPRAGS